MTALVSLIALAGLRLITEIAGSRRSPQSGEAGGSSASRPSGDAGLPRFVYHVAIYGFLMGLIGGGLGRFLPLFAEESVGLTPEMAGRVFGVQGLVAIPTRILSGILLDRGMSARRTLIVMGAGGAGAVALILASTDGSEAFLWIGTILAGLTLGSWNTAANLAMIRERRGAGRASGVLIFGFLAGLTLGGPIVGRSIDTFDSYSPAWAGSAILALIATAVVTRRPREAALYP